MTTQEIIDYYANLLVLQYLGKPKAYATIQTSVTGVVMDQLPTQVQDAFNLNATVQTIEFSDVPASGLFDIGYGTKNTVGFQWNSTTAFIQLWLNQAFGTNTVSVSGSLASQTLTFTFGLTTAPLFISVPANSLKNAGAVAITATVSTNLAQGVQLDVLGKYAGVSRSGIGSSGPITLDDADFIKLIQMAAITNAAGSSLATIVSFLVQYFPNEVFVFDYALTSPMSMSYFINSSIGSQELVQLFISEGLLPKPMGVSLSVIIAPVINKFFGFCDYSTATPTAPNTVNTEPFNCAVSYTALNYNTTWPFIDYSDSI